MSDQDRVRTVVLAKPPANAIDLEMAGEIREIAAISSAERDGVGALLFVSESRYFSLGADIKAIANYTTDDRHRYVEAIRACMDAVASCPVPTVAAVNAYAAGGGLELALACDVRVVSLEVRLSLPEVKLGLIPGAGGTQRLVDLIGPGRALDVMMSGRPISAAEARDWGLATRVSDADLRADAHAAATTLAELPTDAVSAVRTIIQTRLRDGREAGFAAEGRAIRELIASPAANDLIAQFAQR